MAPNFECAKGPNLSRHEIFGLSANFGAFQGLCHFGAGERPNFRHSWLLVDIRGWLAIISCVPWHFEFDLATVWGESVDGKELGRNERKFGGMRLVGRT